MSSSPSIRNRAQWMPILSPSDRSTALGILDAVTAGLIDRSSLKTHGRSLADGSAGVAVFFFYLWKTTGERRWLDEAASWMSDAVGLSASDLTNISLFGGMAGRAWAARHLRTVSADAGKKFEPIVERILLEGLTPPWPGSYDLISGLVGYGVYGLERGDDVGASIVERVVDCLAESSVPASNGTVWWTSPGLIPERERDRYPDGYYNLGLAHGVPGVIAFLAQASSKDGLAGKAKPLLERAVDWLLSQENPPTARSCFSRARSKKPEDTPSITGLAWCYGDLGVSASLYHTGVLANEIVWQQKARSIAIRAARRSMEYRENQDACICHSTAGNGHIFNRLYQATGEQMFLEAARHWFAKTFSLYKPGVGVGGFEAWWDSKNPGHPEWQSLPGLLLGAAGIGLALLAACYDVEPLWDRVLLVAIPPLAPENVTPSGTLP